MARAPILFTRKQGDFGKMIHKAFITLINFCLLFVVLAFTSPSDPKIAETAEGLPRVFPAKVPVDTVKEATIDLDFKTSGRTHVSPYPPDPHLDAPKIAETAEGLPRVVPTKVPVDTMKEATIDVDFKTSERTHRSPDPPDPRH